MKKLLVIPHAVNFNVKVRSHEIAKHLTNDYEIFYLTWIENNNHITNPIRQKLFRMWKEINQAVGRCTTCTPPNENMQYVTAPTIFRIQSKLHRYNRKGIARLCQRYGIRTIFNASGMLHVTAGIKNVTSIYDLVDDHAALASSRTKFITEQAIAHEVANSDAIVTISHALIELIRAKFGRQAHYVPNGVDIKQMTRGGLSEQVTALRKSLGLQDKWVIGCIGNHGPWSGLKLLLNSFEAIKNRIPDAVVLVVGSGKDVDLNIHRAGDRVIFTGSVPPHEVPKYFHAIDVGTLPFDLTPFTDNALPLKVLEYGVAGKFTISTPLKELKTLALSGVVFADPNTDAWARTMVDIRTRQWNSNWAAEYERFDWACIGQTVSGVIEQILASC